MAHGDAREGKWRGNWRMECVASTLHTTSEHVVSSITTITSADAHTSAASSWLNWRPRLFKWTRPFRRKTKSGFCACAITFQTQSNTRWKCIIKIRTRNLILTDPHTRNDIQKFCLFFCSWMTLEPILQTKGKPWKPQPPSFGKPPIRHCRLPLAECSAQLATTQPWRHVWVGGGGTTKKITYLGTWLAFRCNYVQNVTRLCIRRRNVDTKLYRLTAKRTSVKRKISEGLGKFI